MIDIVIPLGRGSNWQDNEIRFCLRGIEKHIAEPRVFIIGHKPAFIQGVSHYQMDDVQNHKQKEANIHRKIMLACNLSELSERFLFMNDDHFLLAELNKDFPAYYDGTLSDRIDSRTKRDSYFSSLVNTEAVLKSKKKQTKYYDIHYPVFYQKSKYISLVGSADWGVDYGYTIKSLYANQSGIRGKEMTDCKLFSAKTVVEIKSYLSGKPCFSIGDGAINGALMAVMSNLYPKKSRYEI
jgi:hypothetical protein